MVRTVLARIRNPHARICGCDADCWCKRTAVGRLVKWWFPARRFGIEHRMTLLDEWKRGQPQGALEAWKREKAEGVERMSGRQPKFESIVRLGPMRFGMKVRLADGTSIVHELGRPRPSS